MPSGYSKHNQGGWKHKEDSKLKVGLKNKGKIRSLETRLKIGLSSKGRKHSKETILKISKCHIGKKKGIKLSEAHKNKLSQVMMGRKVTWGSKISEGHRGAKSYNWKGGRKILKEIIRACFKYRQWRSDIFTRDNYTCQFCGIRGSVEINADHIKPLYLILDEYKITTIEQALDCEELWNINNGRTLCVECHRKTDTWGKPSPHKLK